MPGQCHHDREQPQLQTDLLAFNLLLVWRRETVKNSGADLQLLCDVFAFRSMESSFHFLAKRKIGALMGPLSDTVSASVIDLLSLWCKSDTVYFTAVVLPSQVKRAFLPPARNVNYFQYVKNVQNL